MSERTPPVGADNSVENSVSQRQEPEGAGGGNFENRVIAGAPFSGPLVPVSVGQSSSTPIHLPSSPQAVRLSPQGVHAFYKPFSARHTADSHTPTPGSLLDVLQPSVDDGRVHPVRDDEMSTIELNLSSNNSTTARSADDERSRVASSRSGALDSTAEMLLEATLPDGHIDYDRLRALRQRERNRYKKKIERERAKRAVLEEVLLNHEIEREQSLERHGRPLSVASSSATAGSSLSRTDTSVLYELLRRHLKKKHRSSGSRGDRELPEDASRTHDQENQNSDSVMPSADDAMRMSTAPPVRKSVKTSASAPGKPVASTAPIARHDEPREPAQPAGSAMLENYYESTSLFSWPLTQTQRDGNGAVAAARDHQQTGAPSDTQVQSRRQQSVTNSKSASVAPPSMRRVFTGTSAAGWWWVSTDGVATREMPQHLQDRLLSRHALFVSRSEHRQRCIAAASAKRRELGRLERDVARRVTAGDLPLEIAAQRLFMAAPEFTTRPPRAFSRKDMEEFTKKKVVKLPEFQARLLDEMKRREYATNRVCAEMYKQKLFYLRTLKRMGREAGSSE